MKALLCFMLAVSVNAQVVNPTSGGTASIPFAVAPSVYYQFLDGSGTTVTDSSGNGHNATLQTYNGTPTWGPSGLAITQGQGVKLSTTSNTNKTKMFALYVNPYNTQSPPTPPLSQYPAWITNDTGSGGFNWLGTTALTAASGAFLGSTFSMMTFSNPPGIISATNATIVGFHVVALVCGDTGTTVDHFYVDGQEVANYTYQNASCGLQSSGNEYIGSSNVAPWNGTATGMFATLYGYAEWTGQLTSAQILQTSAAMSGSAAERGIRTTEPPVLESNPTLLLAGDSIGCGFGGAQICYALTPWINSLTLTNQPTYTIRNYAIPGFLMYGTSWSEPARIAPRCVTAEGPAIAIIHAGSNDMAEGLNPGTIWSTGATEISILKRAGCRVLIGTMIDRGATSSAKNAYDTYILNNAKLAGADGVIDFAANPLLGADGANANGTYFQDGTHPTAAGLLLMATAASNSLNYYTGSTGANPTQTVATTYTMVSADRYLVATPGTVTALTLPDCTGPSGEIYTIQNNTALPVTVVGKTAAQTINGLTSAVTLAVNHITSLQIIALPKTASGCVWAF